METIDLALDEKNDLTFQVVVQGAQQQGTAVRFVLESEGIQHSFPGTPTGGDRVDVVIPSMKKFLSEGTYDAHLEVVAEDRFFVPLRLKASLKETVKVSAASVVTVNESKKKSVIPEATLVTASVKVKDPVRKAPVKEDVSKTRKQSPSVQPERNVVHVAQNETAMSEDEIRSLVKEIMRGKLK